MNTLFFRWMSTKHNAMIASLLCPYVVFFSALKAEQTHKHTLTHSCKPLQHGWCLISSEALIKPLREKNEQNM